MDIMPRKRLVFDLIQKLTCKRLQDVKSTVVKTKQKNEENVESYLKNIKDKKGKHGEDEDEQMKMILDECGAGPVTDERAEQLTQGLIGWPGFRDVFCIVAKKGEGVADLKNYIIKNAKQGGHRYNSGLVHDQDPRELVINTVKSKLLDNLDKDLPYKFDPVIQLWQYDAENKILNIVVSIETKTKRETVMLIGPGGETISLLSNQIEGSLIDYFETDVKFKLEAKSKISQAQAEETSISFDNVRLGLDPRKI